ncbi:MAG: thiamine phosphate synthase [Campylobacterota bacterium]|nr:thiamine phosphate synthase [Campylobacterota bacterium]
MSDKAVEAYLISDPEYYGKTAESVAKATVNAIEKFHPEYACFRDKSSGDYASLAAGFIKAAKAAGCGCVLLHGDVVLAEKLGADGVHLTSMQFDEIEKAKALGLYTVISTHTHEEVFRAAKMGADAVTYSPIFTTPNKGEPKGLEDLNELVGKISLNIFALGGITTPRQVQEIESTGVYGFASIRYFLT